MKKHVILLAVLALLCVLFVFLSLWTGRSHTGMVFGFNTGQAATDQLIFNQVRLPRTLLLILAGAVLGLTGAVMQGLLRNPLAEPGIIGTSGSSALGAVLVFYFAAGTGNPWLVSAGGILGATLSLVLLWLLARREATIATLILAGIAINAISAALIALALNLAPDPFAASEIMFWLMGSVTDRPLGSALWLLPWVIPGMLMMLATFRALDALTLGEDTASSLGFNLNRVKLLAIGGAGIAVGAVVSVTGSIGFVGLMVPHFLRPFVGNQPGRLLLPSLLGGICLLIAADLLIRLIPYGPELKLGVVTALVGAPFFVYLVIKLQRVQP